MFDWEYGNALHYMQGNQALSPYDGEVSWFFSSCGGNLEYILKYGGDDPSNSCLFSDVRTLV